MKFAHISDCHLGVWRNDTLKEINFEAFERAQEICKEEHVDFILITGDLFDTSRPPIDILTRAVKNFRKLKEHGISIYVIQGSHDFSPTGKTFLKVLEEADIIQIPVQTKQVENKLQLQLTTDEKTGVQLAGLPGKIGGLDEIFYKHLERGKASQSSRFKIFMFHKGIKEVKPEFFEHMDTIPQSLLPTDFNYYAGGHIHKPIEYETADNQPIIFPGPLFPTNYRELENFKNGGFYLVDVENENIHIERKELSLYDVETFTVSADNRAASEVNEAIKEHMESIEPSNKIVLIRVEGALTAGTPSDINFRSLRQQLESKGAKVVRFHTADLSTQEFEELTIRDTAVSQTQLEKQLIKEHVGQHELDYMNEEQEIALTKELIRQLSVEKKMDETNDQYSARLQADILSALDIKDKWREYDEV